VTVVQVYEVLTQLILDNLTVSRWLFKLDRQCDGRGIAYIDVAEQLTCYEWCIKEARRYGPDEWHMKSAQVSNVQWWIQDLPEGGRGGGGLAEHEPKWGSEGRAPTEVQGQRGSGLKLKDFCTFLYKKWPKVKDLRENLPPCLSRTAMTSPKFWSLGGGAAAQSTHSCIRHYSCPSHSVGAMLGSSENKFFIFAPRFQN